MVPFGLAPAQFLARYRRCLDRAAPHLIAELRALIARPVPATVRQAEVQIFMSEDGEAAPAAWIYFTGPDNRVDRSDKASIFAGQSLEIACGLDGMDQFDARYFTDDDYGGLHLSANAAKAWFAECWWKAGGWTYPVPASVLVHDDRGDGNAIALAERGG